MLASKCSVIKYTVTWLSLLLILNTSSLSKPTSAPSNNSPLSSTDNNKKSFNEMVFTKGSVTGFPIPRFVSTKSVPVNVRAGPGRRYPIKVAFKVKVPVQIIDEYRDWRKIRDWDGDEGWIHNLLLDGRRKLLVNKDTVLLLSEPDNYASIKAKLSRNVVMQVQNCTPVWCKVTVLSISATGYVKPNEVWGVFKDEVIN